MAASIEEYASLAPIFQRYRIHKVAIFGSRARGDHKGGSDYDFLVEFAPKASLLDWGGLVEDLQAYYGAHVDIVAADSLAEEDASFRESVLKDARVIYEAS